MSAEQRSPQAEAALAPATSGGQPTGAASSHTEPPQEAEPGAAGPHCPLCHEPGVQTTTVSGALGLGHHVALVCPHCHATLREHGDGYQLISTGNTALPAWQSYAHQTLSATEWAHIAAGCVSNAEQAEADLVEAMTQLREGRVRLQPSSACPVLLKGGEEALFVLPGISLHEPRSVTRGAYGGPSVRVAKGITLRVGGFQAQSHEELKEVDAGTLSS